MCFFVDSFEPRMNPRFLASLILYVHGNQKGSLGRTAQDGHLDSHTAPKL